MPHLISKTANLLFVLALFGLTGPQVDAGGHHSACCDSDRCCDALGACDGGCDSAGCKCCCPSHDCYVALRLGASFNQLESSGFNTAGAFFNTGDDDDDSFDVGAAIGVALPASFGTVRVECEALSRDMFDSVTNSFRPPTPSFFYQVDLEDRWSVMGNVWVDRCLTERFDYYFGGGLGRSGGLLTVNDGVVGGRDRFGEFAWQVGGGLKWKYSKRLSVDLGYRYVDYGTALLPLSTNVGGVPAGDYGAELTSHQIILGVQYNKLGDLLP